MHLDGLCYRTQIERFQMRHAMPQKTILLAHDFGGDLENGLRPLIERLDQPVGGIETFRQIGLGLLVGAVAGIRTAPTSRPRPICRNRSEEHTSELQSLMRISYVVFCLKKNNKNTQQQCINTLYTIMLLL